MYTPNEFKIDDAKEISSFMEMYPFATVVALFKENQEINHLPIQKLSDGNYYGHISKNNKLIEVQEDENVTLVFTGPNAYIFPLMYESDFNVPTWNYSAVHCHGNIHFIDDNKLVWKLFQEQVALNEGDKGWKLPDEISYHNLVKYISFFRFDIRSQEAKYKFSQNKIAKDQLAVIDSLEQKGESENASFMRKACTLDCSIESG